MPNLAHFSIFVPSLIPRPRVKPRNPNGTNCDTQMAECRVLAPTEKGEANAGGERCHLVNKLSQRNERQVLLAFSMALFEARLSVVLASVIFTRSNRGVTIVEMISPPNDNQPTHQSISNASLRCVRAGAERFLETRSLKAPVARSCIICAYCSGLSSKGKSSVS